MSDPVVGSRGAPPVELEPLVGWLERADQLLMKDDPGDVPFLVDDLLVTGGIGAIVGPPKCGKTWLVLELAAAIAAGRPAFGRFDVQAGPVIVVLEESGRAALHRRLDALRRGIAAPIDDLHDLHYAANRRVRLDDPTWQNELVEAGRRIRPAAIFLDPLARLKGAERDENSQRELGPVLDFMRDLRDETGAAVIFIQHTGHAGERMRGTSDLESYWESKITVSRTDGVVRLNAEHREAEAADAFHYRLAWDATTRSMRLTPKDDANTPTLEQRIIDHLREHHNQGDDDIAKALQIRRSDVSSALTRLEEAGTTHRGTSGRRDKRGRPIRDKVWNLALQEHLWLVPGNETTQDDPQPGTRGSLARPTPLGVDAGTSHPDNPPNGTA